MKLIIRMYPYIAGVAEVDEFEFGLVVLVDLVVLTFVTTSSTLLLRSGVPAGDKIRNVAKAMKVTVMIYNCVLLK